MRYSSPAPKVSTSSGRCRLSEGREQAKLMTWIRSQKHMYVVKYPGGIYGTKGAPDVICCLMGRFVAIEMKSETGQLTKLQELNQQMILRSGGIFSVCRSAAEGVSLLKGLEAEWTTTK